MNPTGMADLNMSIRTGICLNKTCILSDISSNDLPATSENRTRFEHIESAC